MPINCEPVLTPPPNFECKSVSAQPVYKGFISWLFRIPCHYIVTAEYAYRSEPPQPQDAHGSDLSPVKIVTETIDHTKTGAKFKAHREFCNVTLNYFALKTGLSVDYIKRLENGQAQWSDELFSRFVVIVAKLNSAHKSDVD